MGRFCCCFCLCRLGSFAARNGCCCLMVSGVRYLTPRDWFIFNVLFLNLETVSHHINGFFLNHFNSAVGDETDTESIKLRISEDEIKQQKSPKVIELKIRKNWKETVYRRIYILTWIRCYDQSTAVADVIAGITLGLTMIPQAIAYAALAQLPSQYGLYAAFMGQLQILFKPRMRNIFNHFDAQQVRWYMCSSGR